MGDLTAAPRPRLAAIKGALPSLNSSHRQPPLLSLTLLDHLHLDISHRSHPIASSVPVEPPQKPPEIDATSSDATGTRRTAVLDNVPAHIADHRRSSGELSDPLPVPPVRPHLAVDDDGCEPLDHDLIVRPSLVHTDSGLKTH